MVALAETIQDVLYKNYEKWA